MLKFLARFLLDILHSRVLACAFALNLTVLRNTIIVYRIPARLVPATNIQLRDMQRNFFTVFTFLLGVWLTAPLLAQPLAKDDPGRIPVLELPQLDNDVLLAAELAARAPGRAPHYAQPVAVDVSPTTGGVWTDETNGRSVWQLRVRSQAAKSLSFGFTEYWMPQGGALYLYAGNKKDPLRHGPFTPADNEVHNELWTQVIEGDDLVIEVRLPTTEKNNLRLRLTTVLHDFLGFGANQMMSGSCNLDVVCTAADGWGIVDGYRDIIRSVAVIGTGGGTFCTGFLVNNARQDCTPYFMTANHCGISAGNAASLVTYWNFENSVCRQPNSPASGGFGDGALNVFNTGAIWRASNPASDMTIVELDDDVHPDANAFFAGWSREAAAPGDTIIAVHHPSTDEKRISFSFQQTFRVNGISTAPAANGTHITIPDWDIGTTEGGSSGSPVFDQDRRVRGQLHGGGAACGNNSFDSYGYFHTSWEGGGNPNSRLRDWLDPDDTGVMFTDGKEQLSCQISVTASQPVQTICAGDELTYELLVGGGFSGPVTLNTTGLPAGITAAFSQNPVDPNTSIILTVSYAGTNSGTFPFSVVANDNDNNSTTGLTFVLEPAAPNAPAAISPTDGANDAPIVASLGWSANDAAQYEYELGTDAGLTSLLATGTTGTNGFIYPEVLDSETTYYWRVRAANSCGFGAWSAVYSFTTGNVVCGTPLANTNTISIPDNGPAATSNLSVSSSGSIGFMTVAVNITHTYVGDLAISLISPANTEVLLMDRIGFPAQSFGCGGEDLELTFSDGAAQSSQDLEDTCGDLPAASGEFQPVESLANFNGQEQNGNWRLVVTDNAGQDIGTIDSWSLTFCGSGNVSDYSAQVTSDPILSCANGNGNVTVELGSSWGANVGVSVAVNGNGLSNVSSSQTGNLLSVNLSNFLALGPGNYDLVLTLTAEDGTVQNVTAPLTIEPVPNIAAQLSPANGTQFVDASLNFSWSAAANADDYTLQISSEENFGSIDYSEMTTATSLNVDLGDLTGLLYWRVVANNECGNATGSPLSFSIEPNAVHQFTDGRELSIYPNPASGGLYLDMRGNWSGELDLNVLSIEGRILESRRMGAGGRYFLDLGKLPAGTYVLDLRSGAERALERIVLLR